jgi:hypothetical protein
MSDAQKLLFFQNIPAGSSFDANGQAGSVPTDYNLQIAMGIRFWKASTNPTVAAALTANPRSGLPSRMPFKPTIHRNPRIERK